MKLPSALFCFLPLLWACPGWNEAHTRATWEELKSAPTEAARVEGARALCQGDATRLAPAIEATLGAFFGSEAEAYLAVAVARSRPQGFTWLSRRIYGTTLDEAFPDVLDLPRAPPTRLDWLALADALLTCAPESSEADRWLALLALADDGLSSDHVRTLLVEEESGDVRRRLRRGLDHVGMPHLLPSYLLADFGPPRDDEETRWLRLRFKRAFEASIEQRELQEDGEYLELVDAWALAFPEAPIPLPDGDRELAAMLRPILSDEALPEGRPSYPQVAAFMLRHRLSGWARLIEVYAREGALPSNALSYVCRSSVGECIDVLRSGLVSDLVSAADLAPGLDLERGDMVLHLSCGELPVPEARQLAARGIGAGMPLRVRQAGVACLMSLGDDVDAYWRELLAEALRTKQWDDAGTIAATAPDVLDQAMQAGLLDSVRRRELRAIDVPWLILGNPEGEALLAEEIRALAPRAFDGLRPDAIRTALGPMADHLRSAGSGASLRAEEFAITGCR